METIFYSVAATVAVCVIIFLVIIIQIKKKFYLKIDTYVLIQNFLFSDKPLDHINQLLCRGAREFCPEIKDQIIKVYKEEILKFKKSDSGFIEKMIDFIKTETSDVCYGIASVKKSYIYEAINKTGSETVAELLVRAARKIANYDRDCDGYESFIDEVLSTCETPTGTRKEIDKIVEKFAEGLISEGDERIVFQAEIIKIKRTAN